MPASLTNGLINISSYKNCFHMEEYNQVKMPLDFLAGIKEATVLSSNCLIVVNAPRNHSFHSQLLQILAMHGFPVNKSGDPSANVVLSNNEDDLPSNAIHYVKLIDDADQLQAPSRCGSKTSREIF
jgi:hypothetical protein